MKNDKSQNERYTLTGVSGIVYPMVNFSKRIDGTLRFFANDGEINTWIVSLDDKTAIERFEYNPDCGRCHLGHPHSKNLHDSNLTKNDRTKK